MVSGYNYSCVIYTGGVLVIRAAHHQHRVAEYDLGVHHAAVGALHALFDRGVQHLLHEADGGIWIAHDRVRG